MFNLISDYSRKYLPLLFQIALIQLSMVLSVRGIMEDRVREYVLNGFEEADYRGPVSHYFSQFEREAGRSLGPGEKGLVGIKVFTGAGAGLATPRALVDAVISELENRGFDRAGIVIFDQYQSFLRQAGFLPPLSVGGEQYRGVSVLALEFGLYYDRLWFHESALPPPNPKLSDVARMVDMDVEGAVESEDDRKSFLPVPLLQKMDFWINLPVFMDDPSLGVRGVLTNLTLSNASNTRRFWMNPASGAVAVAEMASIPELRQDMVFSLASLEKYQFIGGPAFNSLYTQSEPLLLAGTNPVYMDYLVYERMNRERKRLALPEISPRPLLFDYCRAIGLGSWREKEVKVLRERL